MRYVMKKLLWGVHCVVMVYVLSGDGVDVRGDSVGNG